MKLFENVGGYSRAGGDREQVLKGYYENAGRI